LLSVESRDQKAMVVYRGAKSGGPAREVWRDTSHTWVTLVPGSPVVLDDGRLATVADRDGWK